MQNYTPYVSWVHPTSGQMRQIVAGENGDLLAKLVLSTLAAAHIHTRKEHVLEVADLLDSLKLFVINFTSVTILSLIGCSVPRHLIKVRAQGTLNTTAFYVCSAQTTTTLLSDRQHRDPFQTSEAGTYLYQTPKIFVFHIFTPQSLLLHL